MSTQQLQNSSQARRTPAVNKIDAKLGSVKVFSEGTWGSPLYILLVALFTAIMAGFSFFYTLAPLYRTHTSEGTKDDTKDNNSDGMLNSKNTDDAWYSKLDGWLIILAAVVFIASAAGAVALCFSKNRDSMIAAFVAVVAMSFSYHLTLKAATELYKGWFMLWTALFALLGVGLVGYALYIFKTFSSEISAAPASKVTANMAISEAAKNAGLSSDEAMPLLHVESHAYTAEETKAITDRKNIVMGLAIACGASAIALIAAHVGMYTQIGDQIIPSS